MSGQPQYTPAQILEMGQHAEREGKGDHAAQFYSYILDHMAGAPEAADARTALQRLTQPREQPPPPAETAAPRLSLDIAARPIRSQSAATTGGPRREAPAGPAPQLGAPPPPQHRGPEPNLAAPQAAGPVAANPPVFQPPASEPALQGAPQQQPPAPHAAPLGRSRDGANPLPRVMQEDEDDEDGLAEFAPGYRFSRFLAFLLLLAGWLAAIGGVVFAALAIAGVAGSQTAPSVGGLPYGALVGAAAVVTGIAVVFIASIARAAFEAANNTRELLEIERAKSGW